MTLQIPKRFSKKLVSNSSLQGPWRTAESLKLWKKARLMTIDLFMLIRQYPGLAGVEALSGKTSDFHSGGTQDVRSAVHGKIELQSFAWGLEQIGEEQGGRPRSVEHVEHENFTVTKHVDANTPKLFEICAAAIYLWSVDILLFDGVVQDLEGQEKTKPYLAYTMKGVHFASYSVDSDEGIPVETIGLRYGSIAVGWKPESSSGNPDVTGKLEAGWSNMFDFG